MGRTTAARTRSRRSSRRTTVAVVLVLATAVATLACRSISSSGDPLRDALRGVAGSRAEEAEGALPTGVTVFDERPGVANLAPELLRALRDAATDAAGDGIELDVNSGWRAAAYQDRLLDDAIARYGSREEAMRWVATPGTSEHVSGHAVDIGPSDSAAWLAAHGAAYGLCRTYDNEPWHYELRTRAIGRRCPPTYADPTHDPRMQH